MLKIEKVKVVGLDEAIEGMRYPMNSEHLADSFWTHVVDTETGMQVDDQFFVGEKDLSLASKLGLSGSDHAKYRRMIIVYMDITAPLYWWKEFDTYKVGTVANSSSTMHKIHAKEFTLEDFSCEHLITMKDGEDNELYDECTISMKDIFDEMTSDLEDELAIDKNVCPFALPIDVLNGIIELLNNAREHYIETHDKKFWWQMIQLLPSSYNQRRKVMLNYEVLHNIYHARKNHKLDEWHVLCDQIEDLPYSEVITEKPDNTQFMIDYVAALIEDMTCHDFSKKDLETAINFSRILMDIQKEKERMEKYGV